MMRESDRLYEICQQFRQRVKQHLKAELDAFVKGDVTEEKINGAARQAWLDAWQIIIDHMWAIVRSGEKDVAQ